MSRVMDGSRVGLVCLVVLALAGCVSAREGYPSLARRSQERVTGTIAPAPAAPVPSPTPDDAAAGVAAAGVATRVDQLLAQARTAHRAFAGGVSAADRATAALGARGGDSWARASIAVGALESRLDTATAALAELDTLVIDRRVLLAGGTDPTSAAITAAQDEVAGYVAADGAAVARWSDRLGG